MNYIPIYKRKSVILAAQDDTLPVLIVGPQGCGKTSVAEWIHLNGPRAGRLFFKAYLEQCLSQQIIEAHAGTLFIENLYDWPLVELHILLQYLRSHFVLDELNHGVYRLVNSRVICAIREDDMGSLDVKKKMVIRELLFSLKTRIYLPKLAERMEDFEDIVLNLLKEISQKLHKEYLHSLSAEAWEKLKSYAWLGELRELRIVLEMAVMKSTSSQIELQDLPDLEVGRKIHQFTNKQDGIEKKSLLDLLNIFDGNLDQISRITLIKKSSLMNKLRNYGLNYCYHLQ